MTAFNLNRTPYPFSFLPVFHSLLTLDDLSFLFFLFFFFWLPYYFFSVCYARLKVFQHKVLRPEKKGAAMPSCRLAWLQK